MFFFVGFKIHGDLSICDHRQIKECLNISARIKLVNKPFKTHAIETDVPNFNKKKPLKKGISYN